MTDPYMAQPNDLAPSPGMARAASMGRLGSQESILENRARRTRRYMASGFDAEGAYGLASSPNITDPQVRDTNEVQNLIARFGEITTDAPDVFREEFFENFSEAERERLRSFMPGQLPEEEKEAGIFGKAISGVASVLGPVFRGINTATWGVAGDVGGGILEGFEWVQNQVNRSWRAYEYSIRDRGWWHGGVSTFFDGLNPFGDGGVLGHYEQAGMDFWHGEEVYRPGTRDLLRERIGDDDLAGVAMQVASGVDDEKILVSMGYQPETQGFEENFLALQRIKASDEFGQAVLLAEENKMSPGRALASAVGLHNDEEGKWGDLYDWVSGVTDGTWALVADPTLVVGKIVKPIRLARYTMLATTRSDDAFKMLGHIYDLEFLRGLSRWGSDAANPAFLGDEIADGFRRAVPVGSGEYFRRFREMRRTTPMSNERAAIVQFIDHMMAGTKLGAVDDVSGLVDNVADETAMYLNGGVDNVLGRYLQMNPNMTELVQNISAKIADRTIFDLNSLVAHGLHSAPMTQALSAGVGRTRFLAGAAGKGQIFLPRLTKAGAFRLQAKAAVAKPINWALETPHRLELSFRGAEKLSREEMRTMELWLSETMRRNRPDTQGSLDDWTDMHRALVGQGFDRDGVAEVMTRTLTHTMGGRTVGAEDPVHGLARLLVRDGKLDADMADEIHGLLRSMYEDTAKGDRLVAAFDQAAARYTHAIDDLGEGTYVETILDDTLLDEAVQGIARESESAWYGLQTRIDELRESLAADGLVPGDITTLTRADFNSRILSSIRHGRADDLAEGLDDEAGRLLDEVIGAHVRDFLDRPHRITLDGGRLVEVSRPAEYLELVADLSDEVLGDLVRRTEAVTHTFPRRLGDKVSLTSTEEFQKLSLQARANLGLAKAMNRAAKLPARFLRLIPKNPFIDFNNSEGVETLMQLLDLGVVGDDAAEILGRYVNGATPAARRDAVFAAQRTLLESYGILYDPKMQDFVEKVLRSQNQYYGGTTFGGRNVALLSQAHTETAMKILRPDELMSHVRRGRFMEIFSPSYGTLGTNFFAEGRNYYQAFNRIWRRMAIWRPALAPRVALDEALTSIARDGFIGETGYFNRLWVGAQVRAYRVQLRRRGLGVVETEGVRRGTTGLTQEQLVDALHTGVARKAAHEQLTRGEYKLIDAVDGRLTDLVESGVLEQMPELWRLKKEDLRQLLDDAELDDMWSSSTKVLELKAQEWVSEGGKLRARAADAIMERLFPRMGGEKAEDLLDAAVALSGVPTVRKVLDGDVLHVGLFPSHGGVNNADSIDLDDLGALELVPTGEFAQAGSLDRDGREALLRFLQQMNTDSVGKKFFAPAMQMRTTPEMRAGINGVLDDWDLPTEHGAVHNLIFDGDPYADDMVDGFLAPLVKRGQQGNRLALERARWLALPPDVRKWFARQVGRGLDEDKLADNITNLGLMDDVAKWQRGALRLSSPSPVHLDDPAQLARMVTHYSGLTRRQRAMLMVDDRPVRPRFPGAALMDQRYTNAGRFDVDIDMFADEIAERAHRSDGTFGIGADIVIPARANRYGVPSADVAGGFSFSPTARFLNLDAPIVDLRMTEILVDHLSRIDHAVDSRFAEAFDPADPDGLKTILSHVDDASLAGTGGLEHLEMMYAELAQEFGVYGFVSGQVSAEGTGAARALPGGDSPWMTFGEIDAHDIGATVTMFDRRAVLDHRSSPRSMGTQYSKEAWLEHAAGTNKIADQVEEWAAAVAGDLDPLATRAFDRNVIDHKLNSDYWRYERHHDSQGPQNFVRPDLAADETIVFVPRRNGDLPHLRPDQQWTEAALRRGTEGGDAFIGTVNHEDAQALAERLASEVGESVDNWHLVEVRIKRDTIGTRRQRYVDTEGLRGQRRALSLIPDQQPRTSGRGAELIGSPTTGNDLVMVDAAEYRKAAEGSSFSSAEAARVEYRLPDPDDSMEALVARTIIDTRGRGVVEPRHLDDGFGHLVEENADVVLGAGLFGDVDELRQWAADVRPPVELSTVGGRRQASLAVDETVSRRAAVVSSSKSREVAAREFLDQQKTNMRQLLHGGGEADEPIVELLHGIQGDRAELRDLVLDYQGVMPHRLIRRRMKVAPAETRFDRIMNWGFDKVGHVVAEMSRHPQFHKNFVENLKSARGLRMETEQYKRLHARFVDHFGGEDALNAKIRHIMMDFADAPSVEWTGYKELLDKQMDSLLAKGHLESIPSDAVDDFTTFVGIELMHRADEAEGAIRKTVKEISGYIDDHRIRSQAADIIDEAWPFFYATEQFVKRWVNTAWVDPTAFRRLQLYYHGLKASGIVYQGPNGEDMIAYPGSGFMSGVFAQLLSGFPGIDIDPRMMPTTNLVGPASGTLPGLDDPLRFTAGPVFTVPVSLLRPFAPREVASFEKAISGPYSQGKSTIDLVMPSWVTRFAKQDSDEIAAMVYIAANHPELIPGMPDAEGNVLTPTDNDIELFQERVRNVSMMIAATRGITGFVGPTAPRVDVDPEQLSEEYSSYLDAGVPHENALGEFLRNHPNALAHTMFKTTSTSGAPVRATEEVFAALDGNRDFYDRFNLAGPWLLPYSAEADDDEFHRDAWYSLVSLGYREYKDGDEWFEDFKFAQGAEIYFPSKDARDRAIEMNPNNRDQIMQAWREWEAQFADDNRVFMNQFLGQEGKGRRRSARNEMRWALVDPELPDLPQTATISELISGWDQMEQITADKLTYTVDERKRVQAGFYLWVQNLVKDDPMARAFFNRNMLQDLDGIEAEPLTGRGDQEVAG